MSEYQYYEFRALDRRLSETEVDQLRGFSSRAEITPVSFVNEYSYGNFKGNENLWMEKYFDAFLYVANWGTHKLQFALPSKSISTDAVRPYCGGDSFSLRSKAGRTIFVFTSDMEGEGGWEEGGGLIDALLPLRDELAGGDLRALYLGWLLCAQQGEFDDETQEPPVPPNLGKLTRPLQSLADFLRIEPELLEVAAQASVQRKGNRATRAEMEAWVATLPAKEKDAAIVQLMAGEGLGLGSELLSRFNRQRSGAEVVAEGPRRTVAELLGQSS